jgi:hypothetical protein
MTKKQPDKDAIKTPEQASDTAAAKSFKPVTQFSFGHKNSKVIRYTLYRAARRPKYD